MVLEGPSISGDPVTSEVLCIGSAELSQVELEGETFFHEHGAGRCWLMFQLPLEKAVFL